MRSRTAGDKLGLEICVRYRKDCGRRFHFCKIMEWGDLKYFLAVTRSGSLTDAAHVLKVSTATVGRRIAVLERELGAHLFDRKPTGYVLTDSGKAILAKAEEIEEAALAVERAAIGRDLRATGSVSVTTTDDIAAAVITPHLAQFRRRFPDIALNLVVGREVVNLSRREADIALRTVRPARGDYVIRQAGWWNLGLYAARSYADARDLKPGMSDLSKVDVIAWTEDSAHLRGGPWLVEHARGARIALRANSRRLHFYACKAGIGVAILPCLLADQDPDLVCLLRPSRVISVELWLVVHRDIARTARVRAVVDFLVDAGPKQGR
jgi:DNA-binding transcriptional LysR family regulator